MPLKLVMLKMNYNKLYLAYEATVTLMEGTFKSCLGVFDSEKKAWAYLKNMHNFNKSRWNKSKTARLYHYDGELTYKWYVKEVELNVGEM